MIPNNWVKILAERELVQSHFAQSIGINKGTFSRVCGGYQLLSWDDLELCLLHLDCKPQDIYPAGVLMFYGIKEKPKQKAAAKKRTAKRVPVAEDLAEKVDELVKDGKFKNRAEAIDSMVKKFLEESHEVR